MSLKSYKQKRKFSATPEPRGKISKKRSHIFVIHQHYASHLHWDLRLEMGGVLKSWAVPKSPEDLNKKNIKRLAIQVEDHPLEYAKFKGIIPEGNYGAGKVEIWDKGSYSLKSRNPNKIVFELNGKKMHGKYVLLRTSYKEKPEKSWLWFKI